MDVKYDQHFMIDENIIRKIVESSELKESDTILEIGPGRGALTRRILKKARLICIDIDEGNKKYLETLKSKNCEIIIGNALDFLDKLKYNKIVSNLPYSLSEPLFKKLIKTDFELCVFTIGKNFYNIICDENKKLHYVADSFFETEYITDVPKAAFDPKPDAESCIIKIRPKKEKNEFDDALCAFFLQEDKLLKNTLLNVFWNNLKFSKRESKKIIDEIGLDEKTLQRNMDLVSNEDFLKIKDKIKEKVKIN